MTAEHKYSPALRNDVGSLNQILRNIDKAIAISLLVCLRRQPSVFGALDFWRRSRLSFKR